MVAQASEEAVVAEEGLLQDEELAVVTVPLEACVLQMLMKSGSMLIHPIPSMDR